MLQRYRLPHAAAPHDDARLRLVDEKADIVEHDMIVKGFADVAEFDEVAGTGRLRWFKDSRAHVCPLLLMSPPPEAIVLVAQASSLWVLVLANAQNP